MASPPNRLTGPRFDRAPRRRANLLWPLCLVLLFTGISHAAPDIQGKWKSDKSVSMEFNRRHAVLKAEQDNYISQILGNMIVEFNDGVAILRMPAIRIDKDGQITEYESFEDRGRYEILGEDEDSIALSIQGADGAETLMIYHFSSEDQIWVYVPSASESIDLHIREYFFRVK